MHVVSRTYHVPKAGTSEREYEDAACPIEPYDSRKWLYRCAIADGATESSFAREWARRLVRHFGAGTFTARNFREVIPELQDRWRRQTTRKPLPWFAEEAVSRGAFAAFLGFAMRRTRDEARPREWTAIGLGDACLFIVRADRLIRAWPLETADAFSNRPFLLSTRGQQWQAECKAIQRTRGTWHVDDEFYLMTDALSLWFLNEHESGGKPWAVLRDLDTDAQTGTFAEFVASLREAKRLRNDDTTLIRVNAIG